MRNQNSRERIFGMEECYKIRIIENDELVTIPFQLSISLSQVCVCPFKNKECFGKLNKKNSDFTVGNKLNYILF